MCKAATDKKILFEDIARLLHENPKKIFHIPSQGDTYIEVDLDKEYRVGEEGYETKCAWSPFDGWPLKGKVETVVFKGKKILEAGKILSHA